MKQGVYRLAGLVWLMSLSRVFAAGLGDIDIRSNLGERLDARVAILGVNASDAEQLLAQLAPLTIYRQSGIEFPTVLHSVSVRVETDGELVFLRLSSSERINEPIVDLLLQVAAPNGELQRQFTLLLDLPKTNDALVDNRIALPAQPALVPALVPPETSVAAAPTAPIDEAPATITAAVDSAVPVHQSAATTLANNRYGPVKRRETLWLIANKIKLEVKQSQATVMAGLFKQNPQAFLARNPNRLMEGSVLNLPAQWPSESLAQLTEATTAKSVKGDELTRSNQEQTKGVPSAREATANVAALSEQNSQMRGEISSLSLRIAELELRLSQAESVTPTVAEPVARSTLPSPIIAVAGDNAVVQSQALAPPVAAVEIKPPASVINAPQTTIVKPATVVRTSNETKLLQQTWLWVLAGVIGLSLLAFFWLHRERKLLKPAFLDESAWAERKRSARAARHAERNIPTPQDWHSSEPMADAPNVAETMEIKLQYVRSAVDTFILFQRYNEALAFIRREIFEAGHESPLGHRLDSLYREIKDHLQSLGIEETLPNGEAKVELASVRRVSDDQHVVTPLRKARTPNRRDLT